MTIRTMVLLITTFAIIVLGGVYLWARRERSANLVQGRIEPPIVYTTAKQVTTLPQPVILLLLDTSASLPQGRTRAGNDPENREFEATQLLLRIAHHFSTFDEGGFAPRLGIITFGASPRWVMVDGQRVWQLRSPESLAHAVLELERMMGGTGEEDHRRGTFTDFNGAIVEAIAALDELPEGTAPLVLMMTDGEHHPYPAHPWNYGEDLPFDLKKFHEELSSETLRSLANVESVLPRTLNEILLKRMESLDYGKHEPVEYISGLPTHDSEIAAQLEQGEARDLFQYAIAAVRDIRSKQVEHFDAGVQAANEQLLQGYLPQLAQRAAVQIVGLSPYSRAELEQQDEQHSGRRMLNDLRHMVVAAGGESSQLRWCNDTGLAREFLLIFEQWLRLLRQEQSIEENPVVEVGGHVEGLAVLAELHDDNGISLSLLGPGGTEIQPVGSRAGRHLFLIDAPAPGTYRLRTDQHGVTGSLLGLIRTDPLFQVVGLTDRARIGIGPPSARIVAFSAETGQRVILHEAFDDVGNGLVGELVRASGQQMSEVRWGVQRDDTGRPIDFELHTDFWQSGIGHRPGRYIVRTVLTGLKYMDGSSVTPQPLDFEFVVEPGVFVTVHDAEGFRHGSLDFPQRCLHIGGE